jgi:cytochrome P450
VSPAQVPSNVDPSVVVHVDPGDKAFMINPFAVWEDLRGRCPVAYSDRLGGFWIVTGYKEVFEVLHDPTTYCSGEGVAHPRNPSMPNIVLLETDPPMHGKYRSLLNSYLSARNAEAARPEVRQLVTELIDRFIDKGHCDLVEDFARPLPEVMLFRLLGVPEEDSPRVRALVQTSTRRYREDPDAAKRAAADFIGYLQELVVRRRSGPAGDDLMAALLQGEIDGQPADDDEIARLLIVVFSGGLNTVKSQIAGSLLYLAEHPDQRQELRENPSLIPRALEEFLRYVSPIHGLFRTVTSDAELGGQKLREGDKVFIVHGSANRDEATFPDAERCVLDRNPNRHLAFGLGIHRCVGSHLARIECEIAIEEALRRLGDYSLPAGAAVRWDVGAGPRGVDALPVVFDAAPSEGVGVAGVRTTA